MIDFDLLALGDPAIDVANFIAHLHFMGLDHLDHLDALAGEVALFKQSYNHFQRVGESFWERVSFYEAATYFRLLNVVAPRPNLAYCFEPLLERVQQMLSKAMVV